jgi:phosphoserine aminotransferase
MRNITRVNHILEQRQKKWIKFFKQSKELQLLIRNPDVQSRTVLTVKGNPHLISLVKATAKKKGLLLGEGYGNLKADTFRIANFPAIKKREIEKLMEFLKVYR